MSARLILVAFAIGVIGLSIALFAPAAIDPITNDVSQTIGVGQGETVELTERLDVQIEGVNNSTSTVNATFLATNTLNTTNTGEIDEGNTTSVVLDGDTINMTNREVTGPSTADITLSYTALFGWADGPRTFVENLDLMLLIVVAVLAIALAVIGVREI